MTVEIVVLGAGYGGAAAIDSLEGELGDNEDSRSPGSRTRTIISCYTSPTA